jgi:hypothetical protein
VVRRLLQPRDQLKLVEIDRPLLLEGDIARNGGCALSGLQNRRHHANP